MTTLDITSGPGSEIVLEEPPIVKMMSANAGAIRVIYGYIQTLQDKEWLDEAIALARSEMVSDVDEVVAEARKEIKKAKSLIPWHYRYIINPCKFWLLKLK